MIDEGDPFGVLYGGNDVNGDWYGHWIVGIGYASAPGHETLVVSNDPAGGVQRIQSYTEFQIYVGDAVPWRKWVNSADNVGK